MQWEFPESKRSSPWILLTRNHLLRIRLIILMVPTTQECLKGWLALRKFLRVSLSLLYSEKERGVLGRECYFKASVEGIWFLKSIWAGIFFFFSDIFPAPRTVPGTWQALDTYVNIMNLFHQNKWIHYFNKYFLFLDFIKYWYTKFNGNKFIGAKTAGG